MTEHELIELLPLVKAWIAAFESDLQTRLENGEIIEGVRLEPKRPTRRWVDESAVLCAFEDILNIDKLAPRVLLSPAQLEKVLKPLGIMPSELKALTSSESSGFNLKYQPT